jgi:hypothetical protein
MDESALGGKTLARSADPAAAPESRPSVGYAEPPLHKPKLRIGVMLDSFTVEAWQAKILDDLAKAPYLQVALVIRKKQTKTAPRSFWKRLIKNRSALLYVLYEWIDRRRHQGEGKNAFAKVDAQELLNGAEILDVTPIQKKYVDRFEERDIEHIKSAKLDVILRFGFRVIKGEILNCAQYGVWSFHHDDSRYYRGMPPLFWEIYERNPVSGTILQVLSESLDGGHILYRSISATDFSSWFRNKNGTSWKTADFVIRRLRQLYADGWESITKLDTYNEVNVYDKPIYRSPKNRQMLTFLVAQVLVHARNWSRSFLKDQWFFGIQPRSTAGDSQNSPWKIVRPPRDQFYADPFLFSHLGSRFIFFEDYSYKTKRGRISCLAIDGQGNYGEPFAVLERPYHLSYPFVFQWGSEIFMMPETYGNRTVEMYRAVEFPGKWELHRVLLSNVMATDPTLVRYKDKCWLFINMAVNECVPLNDELFLFYSDSPFGPWLPHAQNPIVSNVCSARPAGPIFEQDGQLIRPSQDCSRRYGHKIKLNCIDVLTESEYHEHEIGEIGPGWVPGNLATHTLSRDEALQVMDGCRSILRW